MLVFTVRSALKFLDEIATSAKKEKVSRLRAEVIITTRTTPNNIFIAVCGKKISHLFYWISRGRARYSLLKFNNFFSIKKMFTEVVAFVKKYKQIVFRLKTKGRGRSKKLVKELTKWRVPVFYVTCATRRAFNGCKFPHTRRV